MELLMLLMLLDLPAGSKAAGPLASLPADAANEDEEVGLHDLERGH